MHLSTKYSIAVHCLIFIHEYGEQKKVTSELLALSTGSNPVTIRNIISALRKEGIISVKFGTGGAAINCPFRRDQFIPDLFGHRTGFPVKIDRPPSRPFTLLSGWKEYPQCFRCFLWENTQRLMQQPSIHYFGADHKRVSCYAVNGLKAVALSASAVKSFTRVSYGPVFDISLKQIHVLLRSKHRIGAGVIPALAVHIIDQSNGEQVKVSHRKP